jgi:serine/threonine-protein kinase RsbW
MKHIRKELELKISSETEQLIKVERFVGDVFLKFGIEQRLYGKVLLCLNEAVKNAIEHGNKFDKKKFVLINSGYKSDYLFFKVIDQGNGFDYDSIPNPTLNEYIKNESGRGIHIIRNMCEKTNFSKRGNSIELGFKLRKND